MIDWFGWTCRKQYLDSGREGMTGGRRRQVPVLTVSQWLPGWERIDFNAAEHRAKPSKNFYLFSLPARELRSLSGIVRRVALDAAPRTGDLGIQRQHDPERSKEISRFVEYGFPWSTLSDTKRGSDEFDDLRKPGWLPTAVVLNILVKDTERNGSKIAAEDLRRSSRSMASRNCNSLREMER